jgi:hypothetical protein
MTLVPWTPRAANVFKSAWIPAPPPQSDPAIVKAIGNFFTGAANHILSVTSRKIELLTRVTSVTIVVMVKQSTVVSMRLSSHTSKRLANVARRHGWTVSDTSARLVEEGLRRSEFGLIDFRDSPIGRQAYVQGSSLAVWEVIMIARSYKNDADRTAAHLQWPESKVRAALNYAQAFPDEIERALQENDTMDFEALSRMLPQARGTRTKTK